MRIIDLKGWPRKESFEFFNSYEEPQFNICTNLIITKTYDFLQSQGISKFFAMLWLTTDAANNVAEIRYRIRKNSVVEHERVHPSFTWLKEDKTLTFCLAEYTGDIANFFKNAKDSMEGVEPNLAIADKKGSDGVLYVSCVPWINFTSISHPYKMDDSRSIPRITWGKFFKQHGEWLVPVSLQLHHGLADGYHAGLFFEHLQNGFNRPGEIDWPL